MSTMLKPYPEQQETRIPWLETAPSHWSVRPGMAVLRERKVKNVGMPEKTVLSLSYGRIVIKPEEKLHGLVPASFEGYQIVEPGNIIVRPTDLQNDQVSLRVGRSEYRGIITSAYICLEAKAGLTADYAHLLLHTYDVKKIFYGLGSGLRQNLDWSDFRRLPIPVPPLQEQGAIVRFIRHLDQQVNRLIKAKRRLIELLNEQKQAIIQQAVTRGIDSSVPLKPSGIDWLGYIPKHWGSPIMARQLYSIEQGWSPRAAEGDLLDEQWAVVSLSAVKRGRFDNKALKPIELNADVPKQYEIHPGDLLLTRSNTRALVGDICLVKHVRPRTIISDLIYRLKLRSTLEPKFAMYWLLSPSGRYQIERDARGSSDTMPKISQQQIKGWRIPVPPLGEQAEISAQIERETEQLTLAIEKAEREIDLVREYRTRLVADVVTGQLDVRHLDLPNVIDEPVSLSDEPDDRDDVLDDELVEVAV